MTAQTPAEQALRQQVEQIEAANRASGHDVPPGALICLPYTEARALLDYLTDRAAVDAAREQARAERRPALVAPQKVEEAEAPAHFVMTNIHWGDGNVPISWDVERCTCDRPWRHERLA